ncbi:unnamed protein product [Haemonchus placei]|uniref:Uncharacterized protein n=1 Tax=Haemonchus placei TaxID=6290 RepID=A0A0N4WGW3_HAEPC|nr:unnamed protein product [Haemonchus placei]
MLSTTSLFGNEVSATTTGCHLNTQYCITFVRSILTF